MEMTNFYQGCIYITLFLMVFSLAIDIVGGFQIFGNVGDMGITMGNDTNSTMAKFTNGSVYPTSFTIGAIWTIVMTGSTVLGMFLAWVTQDASILGVFIFAGVFWSAFLNSMAIITAIGIPVLIVMLFTVPIFFIFVGAVIGMLSGV
jgi:hypothetical protein